MPLREWTAVMVGDQVVDRHGRVHLVEQVAHEETPDGGAVLWVGFTGGEVVRVPDRTAQVDLIEGPGWDVGADGDAAQAWCVAEVGRVLGGTPIADGG